ncbi:MAG: TrmH family RNA methyltransferase [Candidatus Saccharimonadales bacterium]
MQDNRNVTDEFKNVDHELIVKTLDNRGVALEIAIENTLRDFSMGTIVRSANAFGVRKVHVIGRKQWNKRGAMMTDKYLEVVYYPDVESFRITMTEQGKAVYALENNVDSEDITDVSLPENLVFVFGQEGPGVSDVLLSACDKVLHIDQLGSTRSLNVGVAAGIAMYEWSRQRV